MPVHFGLHAPLFPYSWCLKGSVRVTPCSFLVSAVPWPFVISQPPSWSQKSWFSVLYRCPPHPPTPLSAFPSEVQGATLTSRDQSLRRHQCLLRWLWAGHVKGNKIRLWWRPDKVSAPMASPGLWQAPGQMFLVTPGWWLTNSISHQNSRPEPGENVKVSWKKAPRGSCHHGPQGPC